MQHPPKLEKKRPKHGRIWLAALTAGCVALAVAFVLLLPKIKEWFPGASYAPPSLELTFETLEKSEPETLESITISQLNAESYTLRYQSGELLLEREGALLNINDAYAEEIQNAATQIAIEDVVVEDEAEVREHLPDMGLEPAQITVVVRYQDGREVTIELGYGVPGTTYAYYRWSGDQGIYMCDSGIQDAFSYPPNRLLPIEQPVVEKTLVDHVRLRMRDGTDMEMSFSTDASGISSGVLRKPYTYPMGSAEANDILNSLQNFRLGALEGAVNAENRAEYGFDAPLCVIDLHQKAGSYGIVNAEGQLVARELEERELRFTIGREEGEYFYTCEYEGNGYLISRFLVVKLMDAQPQRLITCRPADLGDAPLSAISILTGDGPVDVRISRAERVLANNQLETDENGDIVYETVASLNGQSITAEQLNGLIERLRAMKTSGDLPEGWSPGNAAPRWQITMTTAGGTARTIAAYPLDSFSDALMVDGVAKHYLNIEALEIALAEWMP